MSENATSCLRADDFQRYLFIGGSLLSIVIGVLMMVVIQLFPRFREFPALLLNYRLYAELIFLILQLVAVLTRSYENDNLFCRSVSVITQMCIISSFVWFVYKQLNCNKSY